MTRILEQITESFFANRLITLCLNAGGRGLPRKQQDQQILFTSAALALDRKQIYTEKEVNQVLKKWLYRVASNLDLDHVSLRRYLADGGISTEIDRGRDADH